MTDETAQVTSKIQLKRYRVDRGLLFEETDEAGGCREATSSEKGLWAEIERLRGALSQAIENTESDLMAIGHAPDSVHRAAAMNHLQNCLRKWRALTGAPDETASSLQPSATAGVCDHCGLAFGQATIKTKPVYTCPQCGPVLNETEQQHAERAHTIGGVLGETTGEKK